MTAKTGDGNKGSVFIVDDDKNILASVAIALEAEGYAVTSFSSAAAALEKILSPSPPDLVVMDVKMPGMDGREALGKIRAASALPVILLTSLDDEADQSQGFSLGADDYITKPFSQKILLARIAALLRRARLQKPQDGAEDDTTTKRGDLLLDDARHLCRWRGRAVDLTVTEYLIVQALAAKPGHIKTRDQLMDAAYGEGVVAEDRTVDSHIKRIRRKFRDVDADFSDIESVYGAGYRYAAS